MNKVKNFIIKNIKNIPGWSWKRKVVIFESDDWGSRYLDSSVVREKLIAKGIGLEKNILNNYETLESKEDLTALFDVISSVKDKNGRTAVFTPFVNVANPDFERIAKDNFKNYYFEPFTDTLQNQEKNEVKDLYIEGIKNNFFLPQFHGREHLNVLSWLKALQSGDEEVIEGFKNNFYSVPTESQSKVLKGFRPPFYFNELKDLPFLSQSILDGAKIFEEILGYKATVFDPPNGIFTPQLYDSLLKTGITTIVANRIRLEPTGQDKINKRLIKFGSYNGSSLMHYIRNGQFELYENKGAEYCLNDIKTAFRWNKPAIISSHRVNYVGGLDQRWRDNNLLELKKLLQGIVRIWPNVEFMSSGEFADILINQNKN